MSEKDFLKFLQDIITMIDPENPSSIALGRIALESMIELAVHSGKVNGMTVREMYEARDRFFHLVSGREDFAGKPNDFIGNEQKRRRMSLTLNPRC